MHQDSACSVGYSDFYQNGFGVHAYDVNAKREEDEFSTPISPVPVAIYARVSTAHQCGHRLDSCEHQINVCRDFIKTQQRGGWREVSCFTDEAYSGSNLERPGLRRLMAQIECGAIKVVLIYKLERIMRSTFEWCRFSRFLEERGCRLISPSDDWSDGSASGRLKANILMSFAEYERLNVAEKIRSKMLAQAQHGMWGGGVVPFGYDYDRERQQLIPNKEEAAIVLRIFERAGALVPLGQVASELNEAGCKTRVRWYRDSNRNRRSVGGKPFRADALRGLIRNPIYRGTIRFGSDEYQGLHLPLVSRETWDLANAAVAHPAGVSRRRVAAAGKCLNLFRGIIVCESCGTAMLSKASGKTNAGAMRYRYYSCKRKYASPDVPRCPLGDIAADALEKAVIGFIGQFGRHEAQVESFVNELAGAVENRDQQARKLGELDGRLAKLTDQVANCVEVLAAEGARALTNDLNLKIRELGRRRDALLIEREQDRQKLSALDNCTLSRERLRFALKRIGKVLPSLEPAGQADLLRTILDSVSVVRRASTHASQREYAVKLKLRLAGLITAMERGGVGDDRSEKRQPYGRRIVDLDIEICLGPKRRISLRQPFMAELGELPDEAGGIQKLIPLNPVIRALAWEAKLRNTHDLSIRGLAKAEGQSPALISLHLKLLTLAPEMVTFARGLHTENALRVFSLRALLRIANSRPADRRTLFDELCEKLSPDDHAPGV